MFLDCRAVSAPCGFTAAGLPIGLWMVIPRLAAGLISQIKREVTVKPVRWLVNTHFHWDHTQGNRAYLAIGHKVDILASNTTKTID